MDKEDLIHKLTIAINEFFITDNPDYSFKSIGECYYGCHKDIKNIGKCVVNNLYLYYDNLDIIQTPYYFIFNYKNMYIIINYYKDIWGMCEFKVILVKTRDEALRYRYGY
jgi:hypothetical protein